MEDTYLGFWFIGVWLNRFFGQWVPIENHAAILIIRCNRTCWPGFRY